MSTNLTAAQLISTYGGKDQTIQILMQQVLELRQENEQLSTRLRQKTPSSTSTDNTKLNQHIQKLETRLHSKRADLDKATDDLKKADHKIKKLYSQLDRAKKAISSKDRKIQEQEQKLLDYATEIEDLYTENEDFKTVYEQAFIDRDRDLAITSLHDTHSHTDL